MSYSRWNSKESWYCFWHVGRENEKQTLDNQLLSCWYTKDSEHPNYTYEQLKNDREWCWWDIKSRCNPKDRETFDRCVDYFLEDVESEFKVTTVASPVSEDNIKVVKNASKEVIQP